jgi:O-antigen ligase
MGRRSSSRRSNPDGPLFFGLLALLAWLPLPWGSHSSWAISLAGLACFVLLSWWSLLSLRHRVRTPSRLGELGLPIALWLLWLTWIALQAMPLSAQLLGKLSPHSLEMHQPVASLMQHPVYSLSIAPGLTWTKWLESWLYFGIYLLCVLLIRGERRLRLVLTVLLVSGLAQAAYGGMMLMSGAEYGWLHKKIFYVGYATGTFVNRNHFAGYLELAAAAGLALVLADLRLDDRQWSFRGMMTNLLDLALSQKIRARVALVIVASGLVLSRSRAGNLAFFTSVGVAGVAYVLLRERQMFVRALILFASVLAIDVMIVGERFGFETVIERIEQTRLEEEGRVKLLQEIGPVIDQYAMTGSGLGTFSLAYEPYRSPSMGEYMNHAHNDYVEFLVEVGIIGVVLLGALLGWHVWHALRVGFLRENRLRVATAFSMLMAMIAMAVHAFADFNFQIPAVAGTFVALLGAIAACSEQSRSVVEKEAEARALRADLEAT